MITREEFLKVIELARAPSVHNTQPARWRILSNKKIQLLAEPSAQLKVADPTATDHWASLGCAFEAMHLALSKQSLALIKVKMGEGHIEGLQFVLEAELGERIAPPDPLADFLLKRHTFRGRVSASREEQSAVLQKNLEGSERAILVSDSKSIKQLLKLADELSHIWMQNPAYTEELYSWLRLNPKHPRWNIDGLNADVLSLNVVERLLAEQAMRPKIFPVIDKFKLGGLLTSEAHKHTHASLLLILRPQNELPFDSGRQLMRLWLNIARSGFVACPMSILADSKFARSEIERKFQIPKDKDLMNVFRIGIAPSLVPHSPRYQAVELLK